MRETDGKIALVLGAGGGIGGEVAAALLKRGWTVRGLVRNPDKARKQWQRGSEPPAWLAGDAMDAASVRAASEGAALVVHAVNPPGYRRWNELVLPMLENSIKAAELRQARILLPGTVYNFGPDALPNPTEDSPQHPKTRKGKIRVAMEERLRQAGDRGVRTLIVRAGDFFGPNAGNNWFSQGLVKPGQRPSSIHNPSKRGIGHQWAFLPDVAETMAELAARDADLGPYEVFHMEGHWDPDGTRLAAAIQRVLGEPRAPIRGFPWWLVRIAAPVVPLFREMQEMRYLWRTPLHMGNARLVARLGREPHTPLDEAVRQTLAGLGCLGDDPNSIGNSAVRDHRQNEP